MIRTPAEGHCAWPTRQKCAISKNDQIRPQLDITEVAAQSKIATNIIRQGYVRNKKYRGNPKALHLDGLQLLTLSLYREDSVEDIIPYFTYENA